MNFKKLFTIILCTFLLSLVFSGTALSQSEEETKNVYHIEWPGLIVDIDAPVLGYPGDNITLTITTEAVNQINVKYMYVMVYGIVNSTEEVTLIAITHLENSTLTYNEANYEIAIPSDISPGILYGIISCEWSFMGSTENIQPSGFALTYIKNVDLEQLQTEYDQLNATHTSLLEEYNNIESTFQEEVDSTKNLMYIFIATTIVATITVVVLLMRKPKKIWI